MVEITDIKKFKIIVMKKLKGYKRQDKVKLHTISRVKC